MPVEILKDNFASVLAALIEAENEAPQELARETAEIAKSLAPVKTGELRNSIHTQGGEVIADSDHASVVEYGSHNRPGRPFMTPAAESVATQAISLAGNILKEKL